MHILSVNFHKKHKDKPKKNEKLQNVKPNTINDLVDSFDVSKNTVINGDGTALAIHSNSHGNKVCKCTGQCDCNRRYSHIDADFGWDSDLGVKS